MDIQKRLLDMGIKSKLITHAPVYTVTESMAHMPDKFPVKNLLLKEEKGERCVFVICKGDERLDTKKVQELAGCKKLQFAKPEILMDRLGVEPGSASLFSLLHAGSGDVEVVIDARLLLQDEVGFHPSKNTETLLIAGRDIETFLTILNRHYILLSA
jgi:Ala-tRNA(Pro) deacylase